MKTRPLSWEGAAETAAAIRAAFADLGGAVEVAAIGESVRERGDAAVVELTRKFDSPDFDGSLQVDPAEIRAALEGLDSELREAMEIASANVLAVAEAQLGGDPRRVDLPAGQSVSVRDVAVGAAGVYAPGGRAAYPSSVLMCGIPARAAGVGRLALASPPGPDGAVNSLVLAAAALCEVDEVYAVGGAQAIFALAYGTESVTKVDVIAGPGNAWVREAKRAVYGEVGIDSLAGPSELMIVAGHDTDPEWAALDLCAQGEHGVGGPLVAVAVEETVLERIGAAVERLAGERGGEGGMLVTVQVPDLVDAVDLANALAPEHLELLEQEATRLADRVTTAGCVFSGRYSATAFGDYAAGSNHVLPTGGAGRFSGPLGPDAFRRKIATVEVSAEAAAKLAPHVDALARAEGFPVHGESAMIRSKP